jgi:hypothetical protein
LFIKWSGLQLTNLVELVCPFKNDFERSIKFYVENKNFLKL